MKKMYVTTAGTFLLGLQAIPLKLDCLTAMS